MASHVNLAITIIGHNEEEHLKELLPTLKFASEIIYVDCESEDNSLNRANLAGCKIFQRPNNPNLNLNKSFAINQSSSTWIFYIDPDERLTDDLILEIVEKLKNPGDYCAFYLSRRNHYFGKWMKYGSQYPDKQIRLFKRGCAEFPKLHVHEKLKVNGKIGNLNYDLLHYPYSSISQYLQKLDFYTSFEATYLLNQGIKPNFIMLFKYVFYLPFTRFFRRFIFKLGFRDGWRGFFAAFFDSISFILRYFKLLALDNEK
jgi:glycosyltransferase involved in cell wall biosynthesis